MKMKLMTGAPSSTRRERRKAAAWRDPDDPPVLDREAMRGADIYEGERLVRRGRPKLARPKEQVNLRLSAEVLEHFRASGPGWQTRINETLERAVVRARRKV